MTSANSWDDHFARKARKQKWAARSVYKLEEIDRRFRIIRPGARLLDLGCSPGSWTQYALGKIGPGGDVVGIDLTEPGRISAPNFLAIQADILSMDPQALLERIGPRDAVISDLAPKTTGAKTADVLRSEELAYAALAVARVLLRPGGCFLCKVFEGEGIQSLRKETARSFSSVKNVRPKAVRKSSREIYLLAREFKGDGGNNN